MAGGKKLPERDALTMAYNAIENGAAGVDMGRNIFQSDTPAGDDPRGRGGRPRIRQARGRLRAIPRKSSEEEKGLMASSDAAHPAARGQRSAQPGVRAQSAPPSPWRPSPHADDPSSSARTRAGRPHGRCPRGRGFVIGILLVLATVAAPRLHLAPVRRPGAITPSSRVPSRGPGSCRLGLLLYTRWSSPGRFVQRWGRRCSDTEGRSTTSPSNGGGCMCLPDACSWPTLAWRALAALRQGYLIASA